MNRIAKRYYRDLQLLIPTRGKQESQFFSNVKTRLGELCAASDEVTYESICETLGNPNELAADFFSEVDSDHVMKKMRSARYFRITAAVLILAILLSIGLDTYYLENLRREADNDITTDEIIPNENE